MKKRKTALILKRTGAAILSSLLTLACAAGMFACADTGSGEGEDSATSDAGTATSAAPEESTEAALSSAPEGDGTSDAGTGEGPAAVPESLKILAIGNSFSVDSMEYLWNLLKDAGVGTVVLGNLYYGGCALSQHLSFANSGSASYTYYKNRSGGWTTVKDYKIADAIADEQWDIISLQESSKTSGVASAYRASLGKLVDYVRSKNSTATLIWNMTWAYQSDSTHSSFPTYGKDQMKMYTMIVDCVKEYVEKDGRFSYVIPVGTAVQNARTSYLGDHLTRDGYHLNKEFGRYLAALTWACKLTGRDPGDIGYNPAPSSINADMTAVARESVKNALAKPYEVTESKIKTGQGSLAVTVPAVDPGEVLHAADFYEADKALAATNGVSLDGYRLLEWEYLENTYWYCTSKSGTTTPASSASTYHQNICSKKKYSLDELPLGTVFICDAGWQYRLEIYTDPNAKYGGSRPAMSSANFFALNEGHMKDAKYMAWNIASSPKSDISAVYAQAAVHLRIYVPSK